MNENHHRVKGTKIAINQKQIKQFFESRGKKVNEGSPYTSVLYQDGNPEVAYKRDSYEKHKIKPLLNLRNNSCVLDIGCGIGRWADELLDDIEYYYGIDFSDSLIRQARKRFNSERVTFEVLSADDISDKTVITDRPVDVVILSGVLLYLNDSQVEKCFMGLSQILSNKAVIYIREPLGVEGRLTLDGYWSDELDAEYCAIYRTDSELKNLIVKGWPALARSSIKFKPLYNDESLNNRSETAQFYSVIKLS